MKHILYIHQYFKTPSEGGAMRSYFIAKALVEHGYQVQMITSHEKNSYEQKSIDNIDVHYLPVHYSNKHSFSKRYYAFFKFVILALKFTKNLPKPDLIYATSTPLTIGLIALWWKWRRRTPYIFEVRDLWPEAPIQLGILRNYILIYLSKKLEKATYEYASTIVTLSPGIRNDIISRAPKSKIIMVPNMADIEFFAETNQRQKKSSLFTIGYFGAFGYANNVEFIIDIARSCHQKKLPIQFLLVGDGAKKKKLESSINKLNLKNIVIIPYKNKFEIKDLMTEVDACLTTFLQTPILETNSPNKFFEGLAAGKLSIINTNGWLKQLVEENECGIYVESDKPENFPKLIKPFLKDSILISRYQHNAKALARRAFSRDQLVEKICEEVERVIS